MAISDPSEVIHTFDKAVCGLEALGFGADAATSEGHFKAVVVAHEHRGALFAAEDADISRLTTHEDRHRDRVDAVTRLTARTLNKKA